MAMSDEEVTKKYNDLYAISPEIADDFLNSPEGWFDKKENQKWLEGQTSFTRQYKSFMDLLGDKEKALTELYRNQDGEWPTEERLIAFKEQNPSIGDSDIKEWFDKVNAARAHYKKEQDEEAAKYKRALEIKNDWKWRNILASDYERQRYIEDPQSSIFGKESPALGEAKNTRYGSMADIGTGALATAMDFVPPVTPPLAVLSIAGGPAVRGARDAAHLAGSDYHKDAQQVGRDFAQDLMFNAMLNAAPNARKLSRVFGANVPENVLREIERQNIKKGVQVFDEAATQTVDKLEEAIKAMPDSPLKEELQAKTKLARVNGYDPKEVSDLVSTYSRVSDPEYIAAIRNLTNDPEAAKALKTVKEGGAKVNFRGVEPNDWVARAASVEPVGKLGKAGAWMTQAVENLNKGYAGQALGQAVRQGAGYIPDRTVKTDTDALKNKYKSMYDRDWSLGFAPRKKDGDPLWQAYEEWCEERGINPDEDIYSKWQNIIGGKKK
ncbi:MAG: hypothetical protein Q4C03_01000 [bacterium]|nr:hypothetical protein [bacterium]